MLESMPADLFLEWREYAETNPFGEERADLRAAIIAWTFYSKMRGKGESKRRVDWFMASKFFGKQKRKQQTWQEQKAIFMGFAQAQNAMIAKREGNA